MCSSTTVTFTGNPGASAPGGPPPAGGRLQPAIARLTMTRLQIWGKVLGKVFTLDSRESLIYGTDAVMDKPAQGKVSNAKDAAVAKERQKTFSDAGRIGTNGRLTSPGPLLNVEVRNARTE